MTNRKLELLIAVFSILCAVNTNAQTVTLPSGLSPGDEYRLAFVTKYPNFTATDTNIAVYDALVTAEAYTSPDLFSLETGWRVIGSTETLAAKIHTETDDSEPGATGVPIFRLDGVILANDYDDLWDGSIQNPLNVAQDGTVVSGGGAWTGTLWNGLSAAEFALGAGPTVVDGGVAANSSYWIQTGPYWATNRQYLYAISDVLSVPGSFIEADIDIKPFSDANCGGVLPVAVLGSENFDATQVNTESLAFESLSIRERGNGALSCDLRDVNNDGYTDILCQFQNDVTDGVVSGELIDGTSFEGSDLFCLAH